MKARLFIGVPVSKEVQERVSSFLFLLKDTGADISPVPKENLHFTIKFLGDVEDSKIPSIQETLTTISSQQNQFRLTLSKVGVFPSLDNIEVIWIGGSSELLPLIKATDKALNTIKKNDHPEDIPHLTIARRRSEKDASALRTFIQEHNDDSFGEMKVDHFVLYKSILTSSGPVYQEIRTYFLNQNIFKTSG